MTWNLKKGKTQGNLTLKVLFQVKVQGPLKHIQIAVVKIKIKGDQEILMEHSS